MKPTVVSGIIVLALAGYFGYHNWFYLPSQKTLRQLQESLAQARQTQELRVRVAGLLDEMEGLRKRLPHEPETEWLLGEVSRLAEEEQVRLTSIVPQSPRQVGELTQLAVLLQFDASYHQLGKFLSRVESSPRFIQVEELEMSRSRPGSAQVRLLVTTVHVPPPA